MQEAAVQGADPQTTITIAQQPFRLELRPSAWKRIRDALPLNELPDSVLTGDQQSAVVAFIQRLRGGDWELRHGVVFWITRTPSPQSRLSRYPESAVPILVQRPHPLAETAVITLCAAVPDRTQ